MYTALQLSPLQDLAGWFVLLFVPLASLFVARAVYRDASPHVSEWAWQWAVLTALGLLAVVPGVLMLGVYCLVRGPTTAADV